jgi:hypothetical protein
MHEEYKKKLQEAGKLEEENWQRVKESGCKVCSYNIGCTWPEVSLPCGQQHCWNDLQN